MQSDMNVTNATEAERVLEHASDYLYEKAPSEWTPEDGDCLAVDLIDRLRQREFGVDCGFDAA